MNIFYKGEDITLIFSSENDISDYTKVVKVFTPLSSVKTATISEIDDNSFSATITSTQTSDLKTGNFNIVLELTQGGAKAISKTVKAKLNDAYIDGGEREDANSYTYQINFTENNNIEINFGANFLISQVFGWFTFIWKCLTGFTIAELRAITDSQLGLVTSFRLNVSDKKGWYYYDSSDTTTTDDGIFCLVTTTGKRIKRDMIEYVTPEIYGAKANDNTFDSTIALQKAFSSGSPVLLKKNAIYYTSDRLLVDSNFDLDGNNATIKWANNTEFGLIEAKEDQLYTETVNTSIVEGQRTFTLANASNIQVGNVIHHKGLTIATIGSNTYENGWWGVVTDISGTTITMSTPAPATFTSPYLFVYKSYSNINIRNLKVDVTGGTDGFGINMQNVINSKFENIRAFSSNTSSSSLAGINLLGENILITKCDGSNFRYTNVGAGYGINVGGHNIKIVDCTGVGSKHVIASAGRTWYSSQITVDNCRAWGGRAAAIDFHGCVLNSVISNCTTYVTTGLSGYYLRSSSVKFVNNRCYINNTTNGDVRGLWMFEFGGNDTQIENFKCYIKEGSSGGHDAIYVSESVNGNIKNLSLENSYIQGQFEVNSVSIESIKVKNNEFDGRLSLQSFLNLGATCKDYEINGNKFVNAQPNSVFNYSINLPTNDGGQGVIQDNRFYITDSGNNNTQIRNNRNGDILKDNIFYSDSTASLISNLNTKNMHLINNVRVDSSNVYYPVTYTSLPTAGHFWVDKLISVLASNVTKYYIGKQSGSGTHSWLEIADLTGAVVFSSTLQAQKIYAQDGNNASFVSGADASAQTLTVNTTKQSRIAMPSYAGNSMASNLYTLIFGESTSTNNFLRIGGGTGLGFNPTDIEFYTGVYGTAGAGTRIAKFFQDGSFIIQNGGTYTNDGTNRLQVTGSVKATGYNLPETTNGRTGRGALVSGVLTKTVTSASSSSLPLITLISLGGTWNLTVRYVAVCTTNTLTITAYDSSGSVNTADTSTFVYEVKN